MKSVVPSCWSIVWSLDSISSIWKVVIVASFYLINGMFLSLFSNFSGSVAFFVNGVKFIVKPVFHANLFNSFIYLFNHWTNIGRRVAIVTAIVAGYHHWQKKNENSYKSSAGITMNYLINSLDCNLSLSLQHSPFEYFAIRSLCCTQDRVIPWLFQRINYFNFK